MVLGPGDKATFLWSACLDSSTGESLLGKELMWVRSPLEALIQFGHGDQNDESEVQM